MNITLVVVAGGNVTVCSSGSSGKPSPVVTSPQTVSTSSTSKPTWGVRPARRHPLSCENVPIHSMYTPCV